jgi:uncharacterized protein YjbI with pentapeptide repeats
MKPCQFQDPRNRFRCGENADGESAWCFWHDPEQAKSREDVIRAIGNRQNLTGAWLEGVDLSGLNLQNACLYGAVLRFAKLEGACLNRADLRHADLSGANLDQAELEDALLEGSNLSQASLRRAILRYANLKGANLQGTNLIEADLLNAHLIQANLAGTNLWLARGNLANFWKANLSRSNLEQTDLVGANLSSVNFDDASLREVKLDRATNFVNVKYNLRTSFSNIDTSSIDPGLFPGLVRDIRDYQYLTEFHERHPALYWLWKLTSDCGRSLRRWCAVYAAAAVLFGLLRLLLEGTVENGGYAGPFGAFYHSLTHLLTLGWAGGVPLTTAGQVLLLAETMTGYVLFGGLLSLLVQRFARRA